MMVDAVRLSPQLVGRVLVVACCGLLTAQTIRGVRRWVGSDLPAECGAVVMDYRRCAIAITECELEALASAKPPLSPPMPLAWVVGDPETAKPWNRQVLRLAFSGQRRFASCQFELAFSWATEQARLGRVAAPR